MAASNSATSSSDFVRKLYKMLEDSEHSNIVRWGDQGDSFVVVESEQFTKLILPKHFKHSNFASFVRQLNKYDFHKVPKRDDCPYGPNAWEFKHPEFRADRKHNLDGIRRKAPVPRKNPSSEENLRANEHQLSCLAESLMATQQQVQQLQADYANMSETNKVLVNEVLVLQKMVDAQKQAQHELLNHLENQRRNARNANQGMAMVGTGFDDQVDLRRVRELLSSVSSNTVVDQELRRLHGIYGSPTESAASSAMYQSASSGGMSMMNDPMDLSKFTVYPVGETVGIDPFHSEHIHKIPYSVPQDGSIPAPPESTVLAPSNPAVASPWTRRPMVYLVEDDKICSKIGSKFLTSLGCSVEVARDGLEAVTTINHNPNRFDLIFMDIIMPRMDGVSATACIREQLPTVPIIAMTANIRTEDLSCYYDHGMNDVLAKPFTKEGMGRTLRKHLPHLLQDAADNITHEGTFTGLPTSSSMTAAAMNAPPPINVTGNVKFETTPIASPATSSSWHSPGQMTNHSPGAGPMDNSFVGVNSSGQLVMTSVGGQRQGYPGMGPPGGSRAHDGSSHDDRPEKRQRMYGNQGAYVQ